MERLLKNSNLFALIFAMVFLFLGIYAILLYGNYFNDHKITYPIDFGLKFKVDLYGAVLPFFIALITLTLFLRQKIFPRLISLFCYLAVFLLTLAIAISGSTPEAIGLMTNPLLLSTLVSIVVISLFCLFSALQRKPVWSLNSYKVCLLVACSATIFSMLIVDLIATTFALPYLANPIIGGNGLSDGVLLLGMYTPLTLSLVSLIPWISANIRLQLMREQKDQ